MNQIFTLGRRLQHPPQTPPQIYMRFGPDGVQA
jgi:hypothetical protein